MIMIRSVRKEAGLTMKQLGAAIGVSESAISQYESGKRQADYETLIKLSNALNCSIDYLITGDETKPICNSMTVFDPCNKLFSPLKRERERHGYSTKFVALQIGIPEDEYKDIEEGAGTSCLTLIRLAQFFSCATDYLLGFDGVFDFEEKTPTPISEDRRIEEALLSRFRSLNAQGQEKVFSYIDDLIRTGIYKNSDDHPIQKNA